MSESEYEDLDTMDEEGLDDLKKSTHALIAVTDEGEIIHFCAYWNKPSNESFDGLVEELKTDPEHHLVGRNDYTVMHCPPQIFEQIMKDMGLITGQIQ